jgi:hypothetical protein
MRYADELDEQLRDAGQVIPSPGRPSGGRGRIRYAFCGVPPQAEPWAVASPGTAPRADLWVLVCGGIAAAAAFAAAFVASGGVAAHAAPPPAARTVIVAACPTAVPGRLRQPGLRGEQAGERLGIRRHRS